VLSDNSHPSDKNTATSLSPDYFSLIHIVLAAQDYNTLSDRFPELLKIVYDALQTEGTLRVNQLPPTHRIQLKLAGFAFSDSPDISSGILEATKAAKSVNGGPTSVPLSMPLPRRNGTSKEAKKALWSINRDSPKIDTESLITDEDWIKPTCEPFDPVNRPRRKKACKGCTCGLADLLEEENNQSNVVLLDGSQNGLAQEVAPSEKDRLLKAAKAAPNATSSCGSCYLGDAFRCASCPYIGAYLCYIERNVFLMTRALLSGLPAFKPGEKVQIDLGMDDI
jgi:hypothetical protein